MNILAHTSFIGDTGYNNHSRSFFCALNKYHTVKIRNLTVGKTWNGLTLKPHDDEPYFTSEMRNMLIIQTLKNNDGSRTDFPIYGYKNDFKPDVHIVLNDVNNPYFFDNYDGYKIGFCVYESTRFPEDFFKQLLTFDEMWVPSQWQFDSLVEQGYPIKKIKIVTEGVDVNIFKPKQINNTRDKFRFIHFGRWDYRKSTTEIFRTFGETFKDNDNVELVCSVENNFPTDETRSTKDRIKKYDINYPNIKFIDFLNRDEYVKYLQEGDVFVSCARSEGWNLPLIEAMSCGTPSIYSNWGAQLQFARNKGIPVRISHIRPANIGDKDVGGEYCEPDFNDLAIQMKNVYENYSKYKTKSMEEAELIHKEFNWDNVAKQASEILKKKQQEFVFVTAGDEKYLTIIEKLVKSINEFSKNKIIVYSVNCDIPFEYPNMIKRRIDPPFHSIYDKWYFKQHACIESLKENYEYFVWIDGDGIASYNIDEIQKYFPSIENYPISDIHVQEEFFGYYTDIDGERKSQLFNENLIKTWNLNSFRPLMHICLFIYNKDCKWWFEEIIDVYKRTPVDHYPRYFPWNDEGIDNALRWKYGVKKHLPLSKYDTSSYDGDDGYTNQALNDFYKFWNENGPQNFNRIYGYKFIPPDKTNIIWFHGNKDPIVSEKMIDFIKLKRDKSFYQSEFFYTNKYELKNLGEIKGVEDTLINVAEKYGWDYGIYHEIYNQREYYINNEKRIHNGDIVVDLGANIGIFTRWAYNQGAEKVISFEPDKRYFELLKLNSDPRTILFNAAISDTMGTTTLYESNHLGGSAIRNFDDYIDKYSVRTYTLDYLFDSGLVDRIDFLKIGIEGAEHQALKGISDENLSKVKAIAMEYHHAHCNYDEMLRENFRRRIIELGFKSFILFLGSNNMLQMFYFWK
jgi:hypothetical protein